MALDIDYFQKRLEEEKTKLEGELAFIAERNPDAPADWNVKYPNMNVAPSAQDEVADQEEEYENRTSLELGLESQLKDINESLERIQKGTYGICAVAGEPIDEMRLRANPAARTCIAHAEQS